MCRIDVFDNYFIGTGCISKTIICGICSRLGEVDRFAAKYVSKDKTDLFDAAAGCVGCRNDAAAKLERALGFRKPGIYRSGFLGSEENRGKGGVTNTAATTTKAIKMMAVSSGDAFLML